MKAGCLSAYGAESIAVSQVLEQKIDIDDASFSELRFETQPAGGDVPLNA